MQRMFLLSGDEDTVTGMALAGIEGVVVSSLAQLEAAAQRAVEDESIGILLITKTLGDLYGSFIVDFKRKNSILVTEIPDMKNPDAALQSITRYVRDAVGIDIDSK